MENRVPDPVEPLGLTLVCRLWTPNSSRCTDFSRCFPLKCKEENIDLLIGLCFVQAFLFLAIFSTHPLEKNAFLQFLRVFWEKNIGKVSTFCESL